MDGLITTLFNDLLGDVETFEDKTLASHLRDVYGRLSTREVVTALKDPDSELWKAIPVKELEQSDAGLRYIHMLSLLSGTHVRSSESNMSNMSNVLNASNASNSTDLALVAHSDNSEDIPDLVADDLIELSTPGAAENGHDVLEMVQNDVPYLADFIRENVEADGGPPDLDRLIGTMQSKIDRGEIDEERMERESLALIDKLMDQIEDPQMKAMISSMVSLASA